MSGDHRAFAPGQGRLEYGVEIGREMVQAVVAGPRRHTAATVAAMVERDDPVVLGKVGDLVDPNPERAGDAVCQHDRVAAASPEDLGVQLSAVLRADGDGAAAWQRRRGGECRPMQVGPLATSHWCSVHSRQRCCGKQFTGR